MVTKAHPNQILDIASGRVDRSDCFLALSAPSALCRPFAIIAFDWDGTAVVNRSSDATIVRLSIEQLLREGVLIVIITGTNFGNVDRQLTSSIVGPFKQNLYVSTNRGSEVFGFDSQSRPRLLWKRIATSRENRLLTEISDQVRNDVAKRTGLPVHVIYSRLNRRKIDLIPLPEWANPAKSEIGALRSAVEERLVGHGIPGGLAAVFALTVETARAAGLPQARITSDVKHIEVGLTDKSDAIDWLIHTLARDRGIPTKDVLIVGDEFGPIGGFAGSDARMITPAARDAVFVSVGPEPGGVPAPVIHLGGGPPCFRQLLDMQVRLYHLHPLNEEGSDTDPEWLLVEDGLQPVREREIESIFAIANGYLGTRGSLYDQPLLSQPRTFVAGVFTEPPESLPELAIAPDWTEFRIFVADQELRFDRVETLFWRRVLDMRHGLFQHEWQVIDDAGRRTRLCYVRFASLADQHALAAAVDLIPINFSGAFVVESVIDGALSNTPVTHAHLLRLGAPTRYHHPARRSRAAVVATTIGTERVRAPSTRLAISATSVVSGAGTDLRGPTIVQGARLSAQRWEWEAEIGEIYRVEKLVSVYTSREGKYPERLADRHLASLQARGFADLFQEHARAWDARWNSSDVVIQGDAFAQRAIRFAIYHLTAAANPDDPKVSIGARALTGDSYKGHVFWDTEIYILPFFIFTDPPTARTLLTYRYHTLPAARKKAEALGYRGALYAWESASTGEDVTPRFAVLPTGEVITLLTGLQEQHISADIAYAVWLYWQATGDDEFFRDAGAEIILETARFWASRAELANDGVYHIRTVIGPDEYHESVDDDAYTNGMARWNLEHGAQSAQILHERWPTTWQAFSERIHLSDREVEHWRDAAERIYTGFDASTDLIEQFRDYFKREDIDLAAYEPRTAPIEMILGHTRVARSQITKQPSVVLLLYHFWDQFSSSVHATNFDYYASRCAHGSSLSPSIHALVAARLDKMDLAEHYFRQASEIDLANNMGNAAGGIHAGAMGGLWQAVVFGFAGLEIEEEGLTFRPRLLPSWEGLFFPLQWRCRQLRVSVESNPAAFEIALERGESMTVSIGGPVPERTIAKSGRSYRSENRDGIWGPWKEITR
ncbi:MAG TPA: glycosyl hydrolase family 65 protein [Chloroflexota bacterium]|nr:glycosyl hydrolase family 65 protein [Chloroflexota bacterium]